jgi:hypothetical protein
MPLSTLERRDPKAVSTAGGRDASGFFGLIVVVAGDGFDGTPSNA